jgi:hypothetical protein
LIETIAQRFANNPAFLERVTLLYMNMPSIILLSGLVFSIYFFKRKISASTFRTVFLFTAAMSVVPLIARMCGAYPYYSYFALLSWCMDLVVIVILVSSFGRMFNKDVGLGERLLVSSAALVLIGTFGVWGGFHTLVGHPKALYGGLVLLLYGFLIYRIFFTNKEQLEEAICQLKSQNVRASIGFYICIMAFVLPILPYLFTPSPPDSDIAAMKEIMGFIFQGKNLGEVYPGPEGEHFAIRYPWGLPGIASLFSIFLFMGASESLTLVWIFTWGLLVLSLIGLARYLKLPIWITGLFTLNGTFTGYYGLTGGQVQEMLAYAFGIGVILQLIKHRFTSASVLVAASMVTHPIVAVPFCVVFGCYFIYKLTLGSPRVKIFDPGIYVGIGIVLTSLTYLTALTLSKTSFPSQPQMMLEILTIYDFFTNIIFWLNYDTFYLGFLCIGLLVFFFKSELQNWQAGAILLIWFVMANVINGLFGSTDKFGHTATFQAGFSVAGTWVIGVSACYQWIQTRLGSNGLRRGILIVIIISWIFFVGAKLNFSPSSVFVTHSDILVSKYIHKNLDKNVMIAVVSPYSELWQNRRTLYSMMRGDTYRDKLYTFISMHQVSRGNFVEKPDIHKAVDYNKSLENTMSILKDSGATHLFVVSRPESNAWVYSVKDKVLYQSGSSYLFELN